MFEEFDMQSPFLNMAFADEIDMDFAEDFDGDELDPEELEQELEETAKELALSQAQGNWLDGYLDAMDELEDAEDE